MKIPPFISIIIPTYNRADLLPTTLDSFLAQDYPGGRYEIIVADNNSNDATQDVVERCARLSSVPVKYLFEERQGVHYARNSAAKKAIGDILYFTDDDMVADTALLSELVKVFESHPEVGCATGLILPSFQKEPPAWVSRYMWNGYLSLTEKNVTGDLIVSENFPVYSCHQAILRDLFFKAGGFNPENTAGIWIGDGETGLNIKIGKLGYQFAYTAKSIIYHCIPPHRTTLRYLIDRVGNQGYCDSYTDYREHRNRRKVLTTILKRNSSGIARILIRTFLRILKKRESWRFIPAYMMYIYRRNVYEYRLYRNATFRECVEVDDWLTNEHYDIKF
jgi:glycosyltransferase involved in cell wall biosynthesis